MIPDDTRTDAKNPLRFRLALPGRPDQVRVVRAVLATNLIDCPVADQVILLADELCANAIAHTLSGRVDGQFAVGVTILAGESVTVQVADQGGPAPPRVRPLGDDSGGRGLVIVAALADAWGVFGGESGRTVWIRCGWHRCGPSPSAGEAHRSGDGISRRRPLPLVGELEEHGAAREGERPPGQPSAAIGALIDGEAGDLIADVL
jgi:serine/threonine-protein kinase RsbW